MRTRYIKPGFFENEQLAECSFEARLLFAGLWCLADRRGRLEDRPKRIKAQVFPYDAVDINAILQELIDNGLILRYEKDGRRCLWVKTFLKHQRIHNGEQNSLLPPSDEEIAIMKEEKISSDDEHKSQQKSNTKVHPGEPNGQPKSTSEVHLGELNGSPRVPFNFNYNSNCNCNNNYEHELKRELELEDSTLIKVSGKDENDSSLSPNGDAPASESSSLASQDAQPRDNCPHEKIIALYHELLPSLPHVRSWSGTNVANLRARWRESKEHQSLDWWKEFFLGVSRSSFLTGRSYSSGHKPFFASLGWMVKASNFEKILNGNYENRDVGGSIVSYDEAKKQLEQYLHGDYGSLRDEVEIDENGRVISV